MECSVKTKIGELTLLKRLIEEFGEGHQSVIDVTKIITKPGYTKYKDLILKEVQETTNPKLRIASTFNTALQVLAGSFAPGRYDVKTHTIQIAQTIDSKQDSKEIAQATKIMLFNQMYPKDTDYNMDTIEESVKDEYENGDEVDIMIVVDKLLTGYDAPKAALRLQM